MKRLFRGRRLVLMSMVVLLFALNVGGAVFAHPVNVSEKSGVCAPVGLSPARVHVVNSPASSGPGISNNPLCPFHGECTP